MNVLIGNRPTAEAMRWLRETDADAVGFIEFSSPWQRAMEAADLPWKYSSFHVDDQGAGGIALYSRYPLRAAEAGLGSLGRFHRVDAIVETPEGPVRVFVVHPVPPMRTGLARARNGEIAEIAELCAASDLPTIVMGDFNETPFGAAYRAFIARTGFIPCRRVAGRAPTWPRRVMGDWTPVELGIPIDHCFVSPAFEPITFAVGPDVGSDHLPIVADVSRAK